MSENTGCVLMLGMVLAFLAFCFSVLIKYGTLRKMDKVKELHDAWESIRKIMNHIINELKKENELLKYKLGKYEKSLKEISEETGTPYAELARKALEDK